MSHARNYARNGETALCCHHAAAPWIDGLGWFHWNHTFELGAIVHVSTTICIVELMCKYCSLF